MTNLNQLDLNVRLQLINCCYSAMSSTFANDLKYGRKCEIKNRINLAILAVYLEILEKYKIILPGATTGGDTSLSSGTITIVSVGSGDNIVVYIDGNPIATYSATSSSRTIAMTGLASALTTAGYPASSNDTFITVTGSCTNGLLSSTGGKAVITVSGFTGGSCGILIPGNCYSEEEIQALLEKVSLLTGLCFQPPGFDYEIPEGYTLNNNGTISPD